MEYPAAPEHITDVIAANHEPASSLACLHHFIQTIMNFPQAGGNPHPAEESLIDDAGLSGFDDFLMLLDNYLAQLTKVHPYNATQP